MITKELIREREEKLESAKAHLKSKFVGIDDIIDKFVDSVRIWHLLPEIQSRPLIINLWGITGVGKTDLVRSFVNYMGYSDKFCEIQLDSKEGNASVQDYLETVFDDGEQQGVLLLDEIQRFRSINDDGHENNSTKYQDLWMLLSDGTFESNSKIKNDLMRMMLEDDFWSERRDDEPAEEEKGKKKKELMYRTYYWEAARLKKIMKCTESVQDIMRWDNDTKVKKIKEAIGSKEVFEGTKYTKLLIIISGNLDEAFRMASSVEDADQDADVYHEYSKTINMIHIKGALKNRFKPEQIARLGNIHLIYPILNRKGYMDIIKHRSAQITQRVMEKQNIKVFLDQSVYDVIYVNGVFPTQGVRPLLSTISAILENSIPTFVFEYIKKDASGDICISHESGYFVSKIADSIIKHEIPRVLDDIKSRQTANYRALVATHEAGHAMVYSILFNTAPTQVVVNTSNYNNGGFVGTHKTLNSKMDFEKNIMVTLAGRCAEEAVFGQELKTAGAESDYAHATHLASKMIRDIGFGKTNATYLTPGINKGSALHDIDVTDEEIKAIVDGLYEKTKQIIGEHTKFLRALVNALISKNALSPDEFKQIADQFVVDVQIVGAKDPIEAEYSNKLSAWMESIEK